MKIVSTAGRYAAKPIKKLSEIELCALDPLYFIKTHVKLEDAQYGLFPFLPSTAQEKCIKTIDSNPQVIVMHPRRAGVTTVIAAYLLWYALYTHDSTIGIAAPSHVMQNAMGELVRGMYLSVSSTVKPAATSLIRSDFAFVNGSKIKIGGTSSFQGCNLTKAFVSDMACFDPNEQYATVINMAAGLQKGGSIIINSTPARRGDTFHKMWDSSVANTTNFLPFRIHWQDIWSSSAYFQMRQQLGDEAAKTELDCEFP